MRNIKNAFIIVLWQPLPQPSPVAPTLPPPPASETVYGDQYQINILENCTSHGHKLLNTFIFYFLSEYITTDNKFTYT